MGQDERRWTAGGVFPDTDPGSYRHSHPHCDAIPNPHTCLHGNSYTDRDCHEYRHPDGRSHLDSNACEHTYPNSGADAHGNSNPDAPTDPFANGTAANQSAAHTRADQATTRTDQSATTAPDSCAGSNLDTAGLRPTKEKQPWESNALAGFLSLLRWLRLCCLGSGFEGNKIL